MAEWVAAIGTVLAFFATSFVIWRDHRLRVAEREDTLFDEAMKVRVETAQVMSEVNPGIENAVGVTVTNDGRRAITHVSVALYAPDGREIDRRVVVEFLQAGDFAHYQVPSTPDLYLRRGITTGVGVTAMFGFIDHSKHGWVHSPDGTMDRVFTRGRRVDVVPDPARPGNVKKSKRSWMLLTPTRRR